MDEVLANPSIGAIAAHVERSLAVPRKSKPVRPAFRSLQSGVPKARDVGLLMLMTAIGAHGSATVCSSPGPIVSTLFTYEDFGSYQIVTSTYCGESYVLYPKASSPPDLGRGFKYFGVPLESVVLTQTPPVAFIETIGARSAIAVASEYTTSACLAQLVEDGSVETYSSETSYGGDEYDAIFTDPWSLSSWSDSSSTDKLICSADSYEEDPVGSAEWLKFYGFFFDAAPTATAAFCATSSRYACNSMAASSISTQSLSAEFNVKYQVPTAVFASYSSWSNTYLIEMVPYKNKFVMDAGATYPDLSAFAEFEEMHWSGLYTSGYSFPP
jgi:hypothetical protein